MANLRNFINAIANDNRIYTAEDIGKMTSNEFMANEKAIDYQFKNLGIPRESDLVGNPDVIYVRGYTRDDGTEVRAHYRSKPDGVGSSNYEHSGTSTGASANIEQPTVLEGGITYNDYNFSDILTKDNHYESAILNKLILDLGINTYGKYILKQDDAVNMWNIASKGVTQKSIEEYIKRNGKIYNNIEDIVNDFPQYKEQIKSKVKSQFGKEDVPGIVFHENSSIANAVNQSNELKKFIDQNYLDLKSGKEIKGKSISFENNGNLHNALGKVDILSAKSNNDYVDIVVLDTYDFNPHDKNWKVQMGSRVQEANLLAPYYTIIKCRYKF